nr:centrosomal protein of 68 kDa isoform X1 [Nerophis lumbriciformis]XP_061820369.1 centrosomal protein of 68 kDa isoform X1 [Nerophis lumbriciformis]XP_061820378.1 centrosomal protein of 68 kDa isoform X1 [Nerophis lumbriciformis]XP_061820387.1 centrosomal protein of 68 kDa isoform X1 [Nerophis lumbriciformis]XP_061820396.1 centrosomal protein of 68 kDa isoform X1 [Nerophis lumbriciformis]XP_061820405.1 centrosomal protein of 68 kDa isoform X1 [Nerophis lumbriciformis]
MPFCPINTDGCSPGKMHAAENKPGKTLNRKTEANTRDEKAKQWEKVLTRRNVTMAPTSRCLNDRCYVIRKPLFSIEQPSILKKTHQNKHTQKEKYACIGDKKMDEDQHSTNTNYQTMSGEDPVSYSFCPSNTSDYSTLKAACGSPLAISELRGCTEHEEPYSSPPIFPRRRPIKCSFSSSFLEFQKMERPLMPQMASTGHNPTYTPRSMSYSNRGHTELKRPSSEVWSSRQDMSLYEANYWDCAIPKSVHPISNRQTADWNPNREYQALLDYTYPLRPGQVDSEWDNFDCHRGSLQQTDLNLQDSGIELDNCCSFTSLSGLNLSPSSNIQTKMLETLSGDQKISSSDLHSFTQSAGVSLDSLDFGTSKDVVNCHQDGGQLQYSQPSSTSALIRTSVLPQSKCVGGHCLDFGTGKDVVNCHQDGVQLQYSQPSSSSAFIRTTSVLPQSKCVSGDLDNEFWCLPDQLQEPQFLSRQVKDLTARLGVPVTASWGSLQSDTASIFNTLKLPVKNSVKEVEESNKNVNVDERSVTESVRSSRPWIESDGGGLTHGSIQDVENLVEQLCGLTLSDTQRTMLVEQDHNPSLIQQIYIFSSLLEQHVCWLYMLSDKMDVLAAPTDDVKRLLAEYQQEVSIHQPLISRVLHTGEQLLSSMEATYPVLGNTLMLIQKHFGALKDQIELFLPSKRSNKDDLTQRSDTA